MSLLLSDDDDTPNDTSIETRAELLDRFTRAEARLVRLGIDSASGAALANDSNPDVAFLLHALELLLTHRLRAPKIRLLALVQGPPTAWPALLAALGATDSFRGLIDAAKRLGVNNVARSRVFLRLVLAQSAAAARQVVRMLAESKAVGEFYCKDAAVRAPGLVNAVADALDAIGARLAFRLEAVPDNVDSADYWDIYLDDLQASRHLVAVRAQRADALLAAAEAAQAQPPAAPSVASVDEGIDKSLVFRASDNRKVRRATAPRVVAVLEDAPIETNENSNDNTAIDTIDSPNATTSSNDIAPIDHVDSALPANDAVADFFKPVLNEDDLRRQEAAELNDILNRAEAAAEAAAAAIAVKSPSPAPPIVIDAVEPIVEPIVEPVASSPVPSDTPSPVRADSTAPPPESPSPPRADSAPPPPLESPAPTDSPALSNSYRYAYISSQLMGSSPSTRPRTNTSPEAPAVTAERRERATTTDGPIVVREVDQGTPGDKPIVQIEVLDDYVASDERDAMVRSVSRDKLTDANVTEARGNVLFLERRHRPPDNQRNEACYACNRPLRFSRLVRRSGVDVAIYCFFAARYFCGECHKGELRSIPARVVHEWDWRLRKVSTAGASHIDRLWQSRQIDCALVSESSCRALPTYLVQRQRVARAYVAALHACPGRASLLASDEGRVPDELLVALDDAIDDIRHEQSFGASVAAAEAAIRAQRGVLDHAGLTRAPTTELLRRFLDKPLSGCVQVSLAELAELRTKAPAAVRQLEASADAIEQHIARECTRCLLQGSPCGKCDTGNLFEFLDGVVQCTRCARLFHRKMCFDGTTMETNDDINKNVDLCSECR
jgi:hypothetical protein